MFTLFIRSLVLLPACLWLSAFPAMAQPGVDGQDTEFLRFIAGADEFAGELQTAVTTYRNPAGIEVDLVATVHMAERSYYDSLNSYFASRDAVLYELVAEENVRPDGRGVGRGSGVIGFLQTSMTRLLGLSYQLDVINYARPNFIHADLEPQELDAVMEAKGETLFSAFLTMVMTDLENPESSLAGGDSYPADLTLIDLVRLASLPNRQQAFRYLLGQSLAMAEGSLSGLSGRGFTLLDDRNAAALATLSAQLENSNHKTYSIYYGAAHMPGLEEGLLALGFSRVSQSWRSAWGSVQPPLSTGH